MIEVRQTEIIASWLRKLRDEQARARVQIRIRCLSLGNFGDIKSVGEDVIELRIDYGPGYRIYLRRHGNILVILLAGGTKNTQQNDIEKAKALSREWADGT